MTLQQQRRNSMMQTLTWGRICLLWDTAQAAPPGLHSLFSGSASQQWQSRLSWSPALLQLVAGRRRPACPWRSISSLLAHSHAPWPAVTHSFNLKVNALLLHAGKNNKFVQNKVNDMASIIKHLSSDAVLKFKLHCMGIALSGLAGSSLPARQ